VAAKTSVVEVWVEQFEPRLGSDFGWQLLPSAIVTPGIGPPPSGEPALVLWYGQVTVPEASDARQHRLVVAEYEEYLVDGAKPYDPPPTRKGRRTPCVGLIGGHDQGTRTSNFLNISSKLEADRFARINQMDLWSHNGK
jgi:hypothetical protein